MLNSFLLVHFFYRVVNNEVCIPVKQNLCEKLINIVPTPKEKQVCRNDEKKICELEQRSQPKQVIILLLYNLLLDFKLLTLQFTVANICFPFPDQEIHLHYQLQVGSSSSLRQCPVQEVDAELCPHHPQDLQLQTR
jgi:hypothetical protein